MQGETHNTVGHNPSHGHDGTKEGGMKYRVETPLESLIYDVFTFGAVALCVLGVVVAVLYNTNWWPL